MRKWTRNHAKVWCERIHIFYIAILRKQDASRHIVHPHADCCKVQNTPLIWCTSYHASASSHVINHFLSRLHSLHYMRCVLLKISLNAGSACVGSRLVITVIGKPVYWFPTGYMFSECLTGYRIYHTSRRYDAGNVPASCRRDVQCQRIALSWEPSPAIFSQFQHRRQRLNICFGDW